MQQPSSQPKPSANSQQQHHQQQPNYGSTGGNSNSNNAGSSAAGPSHDEGRAPPTYAEAVKGDNKIQTHD